MLRISGLMILVLVFAQGRPAPGKVNACEQHAVELEREVRVPGRVRL